MRPESVQYLDDSEKAARLILEFVTGRALADYESDIFLRSAVDRQFLIVGEALTRIRRDEPDLLDTITDSRRIITFRNILAHDYSRVLDLTVWEIIRTQVPLLIEQVETLRIGRIEEADETRPPSP